MDIQQKDLIAKRALDQIIDQGVKSIRMDGLAKEMHISKRTIYELYKDKEELIYAAIRLHYDIVDARIHAAGEGAPNIIVAMIDGMHTTAELAETDWKLTQNLKLYYPDIYNSVIREVKAMRLQRMMLALELGFEQGLFIKKKNPEINIAIFQYTLFALFEYSDEISKGVQSYMMIAGAEAVVTFLRGLCTIEGLKVIDEYLEIKYKKQ